MKNKPLLRANPLTLSALAIAINAASISICIAVPVLNNKPDNVDIINNDDNLTITQGGSLATIGWDSFNIDAQKTVTFAHTDDTKTDFVTINNIGGDDPSKILGNIVSKGTVFLSNPNGFLFGAGSSVNTGSFLATTSTLFLADDELTLSSTNNASITIEGQNGEDGAATLNANDGGYIALLSRNISSDGAISVDAQGHIILSTLDAGTITLPGLNIGIDINTEAGDSCGSECTLEGSNLELGSASQISATQGTVILSSKDLSSVLNSVISLPSSITAEHLHINASDIEIAADQSLNYSSTSVNNLHLNADDTLTILGEINVENVNLHLKANDTLTLLGDITGDNLDLNLSANKVTIGTIDSNYILGGGKLKGINISTHPLKNIETEEFIDGNTLIYNGLKAQESINIDSVIEYQGTVASDLKFETTSESSSGSITLHQEIKDVSVTKNTGLILVSNKLSLNAVSDFDSVGLDAANIFLSGDITAGNSINAQAANLYLEKNISLNTSSINLDDAKFASLTGNDDSPYSLTLDSGEAGSNFNLQRISNNDSIATNNNLDYIGGLILRSNSNGSNNILMSGSLTTSKFEVDGSGSIFKLRLTEDLEISGLTDFDSQNSDINGNFDFMAIGNDSKGQATVGNIGNTDTLKGLSFTKFDSITLNQDIRTGDNGLALSANNILVNKLGETLTLTNLSSGKTSITGELSSTTSLNDPNTLTSISIETVNGDIELGSLIGLQDVNITQIGNASILLQGDIEAAGTINLSDLGEVIVAAEAGVEGEAGNITFSSNTFNSNGTYLYASNNETDITIRSKSNAQLDKISANNITIEGTGTNKSKTILNDDVTAINNLNFLNTDITLSNDLSLTGNINFLSIDPLLDVDPIVPTITINGPHDLTIDSSNDDMFIHGFGDEVSLNSLTIKGDGNLTFNSNPKISEGGHLSLLGDISIKVSDAHNIFDYNNVELDFSRTTINGDVALTFNTGSADLSLGSIGNDSEISKLIIKSTGNLHLFGDITLVESNYDFSSLRAIQIYKDMVFGSLEVPATVDFGTSKLDGTYSLTLFGKALTLGTIGSNIALQDLTIHSSAELLKLNNDITTVGFVNINADKLELNNTMTTTGSNINITTEGDLTMSETAILNADVTASALNEDAGNINLLSNTGNISLGSINALEDVNIDAAGGAIFNSINDYISKSSTSINITSKNVTLNGLSQIGFNVKSPIVINIEGSGGIKAESTGSIYIANLNSADVSSRSRVIDSSSGAEAAANDAYSQFNLSTLNQTNAPTVTSNLGLISNLAWQTDEEKSIRKIKTPNSAPPIYYSRRGWRLGY